VTVFGFKETVSDPSSGPKPKVTSFSLPLSPSLSFLFISIYAFLFFVYRNPQNTFFLLVILQLRYKRALTIDRPKPFEKELKEIDFEDILTIFEIPPPPQERPQESNTSI
jgi:hypothetical protein